MENIGQMSHIVCGMGDVGKAISDILRKNQNNKVIARDINDEIEGSFDILHVCFPYSNSFPDDVMGYVTKYKPSLVIIHSTVPPGTTDLLGVTKVVHSPVRGRHPFMVRDIETYVKYFGGEHAESAAKIFEECGITTKCFPHATTTELGKLFCNISWGLNIAWAQEQDRICKHYGVSYTDTVVEFTKTRNEGLEKVNRPNAKMPVLFPGVIGGHCVMPNVDILLNRYFSKFLSVIRESNERYGRGL